MTQIVYLNGKYCEANEAKISIFDRGFLFADSIYEIAPVYQGRLFYLDKHLQRLASSLEKARIPAPKLDWASIFNNLIERNGGGDLQIYLQVTRGNSGGRQLEFPTDIEPTVIAYTLHLPYPTIDVQKKGMYVELVNDIRWLRCDIKSTAMIANVLMNDDAVTKGAATAVLVRDGLLIEGSASNLFLVDKNGTIKTPPLNNLCLPGVTRQVTIELIRDLAWPLEEKEIPAESIFDAEEVWITSTTKEVFPVTKVNEVIIGNGNSGKYWCQINEKFQLLKQRL
ncbi:MAG: aminotransferase class IV [Tatlockia sp.]|nr:aminotransferase class IV [Tatlockia sp.]